LSAYESIPLFRSEVADARKQRVYGEIVLGQPVGTQALVVLLAGIIALLAAWLVLGQYTRTETARGILVTDSASAKVVAVRPGLVTRLAVREGDLVRPGQMLASIQVEPGRDGGGSAIADSLTAVAAQRRLAEDQVRYAGQRAGSERARLLATLAGLAQQRLDLAGQIGLQRQLVGSAQEMFNRIGSVLEKGFVSRVEYERRRQAMLAARQQLGQLQQQSNALAAEERRTAAELARIDADAGTAVATARSAFESLAQQQAQLASERSYAIAAPVAGRVTALQVAAGRTVDSSVPLMIIVPEGSALHADVYAPTRAIGFVKPGQEVRLLFDAFPYQRFGSFKGRVARISRTAIDPRELSAPLKIEEAVYRIEVVPERQQVEAFGETLPLQPGMTLNASLILDRRSFLDWLLTPLRAVLRRSG
jgi:membrane fusion protein